jgi:hypothetical protein
MRVSNRSSSFGMKCVQCGNELIAPERSKYWSDKRACHIWYCRKCSCCFDSLVLFPAETKSMKNVTARDDIFPSLLVA